MAKKTIASKVSDYFASNKGRKEVHTTSDGFLFERKQDANSHGKTLEDKNVTTFTKSGKVEDITVDAETITASEKEVAKVAADKKAAAKKVEEAKKQSEEDAKKQSENTAGAKKHPANTGSDQKTAK